MILKYGLLVLTLLSTAGAAELATPTGLRVTLDVKGERLQALVTDPSATKYVLSFVKGEARPLTPLVEVRSDGEYALKFATNAPADCQRTPALLCPSHARIVKVSDCRNGVCTALRGVYSGRSPAI